MWYLTKEKKDELCKQRDAKTSELHDLQRKSPSDLWKADLAAFVEELERVEEKDRADEQFAVQGKVVKGKSGRPQVKKMQLQEILPSPHGRRIIPRVTTAMKAEATKKVRKRVKSEDIAKKMDFGEDDEQLESAENSPENSPEGMTLAERLSKKVKAEPGTKAKATKKQATLPFKPVKKEPESKFMDSESDSEPEVMAPRAAQPRRAAANVKYVVDSDGEKSVTKADDSDIDSDAHFDPCVLSDDESFEIPKPTRKPKAAPKKVKKDPSPDKVTEAVPEKAPEPPQPVASVVIDSEDEFPIKPPVTSAAAKKKLHPAPEKAGGEKEAPKKRVKKAAGSTAAKKDKQPSILEALSKPKPSKSTAAAKRVSSDDDEIPPPKKTTKPRKRKNSDSDSDSDFGIKPKTKPSKKSKAMDDSDFNVNLSDSDGAVAAAPARSRTARAKKIAYIEDSEDDDMF